jgi:hypothetical protein
MAELRKSLIPFQGDYDFNFNFNEKSFDDGNISISVSSEKLSTNPAVYPTINGGDGSRQGGLEDQYFPIATFNITNKIAPGEETRAVGSAGAEIGSRVNLTTGTDQEISLSKELPTINFAFGNTPNNRPDSSDSVGIIIGAGQDGSLQQTDPAGKVISSSTPFRFDTIGVAEGKPREITNDALLGPGNSTKIAEGETKQFTLYGRIFTAENTILTSSAVRQYVNRSRSDFNIDNPSGIKTDNGRYELYFRPGSNLTLDNAAKILGFDHFNWYQKITRNDRISSWFSSIQPPYTDPPKGATPDDPTQKTDDYPYYFNEKVVETPDIGIKDPLLGDSIDSSGRILRFTDKPTTKGTFLFGNPELDFETYLVGVDSSNPYTSTPLYKSAWQTNYTESASTGKPNGSIFRVSRNISKLTESEKILNVHYAPDVLKGGGLLYTGDDIRDAENGLFASASYSNTLNSEDPLLNFRSNDVNFGAADDLLSTNFLTDISLGSSSSLRDSFLDTIYLPSFIFPDVSAQDQTSVTVI